MLYDRQPKTQSSVAPRCGRIGLPEAIKHEGQELRPDADAESATQISKCESTRSNAISIRPPEGVNFTAFVNRFQNTCCNLAGSPLMRPTCAPTLSSDVASSPPRRKAAPTQSFRKLRCANQSGRLFQLNFPGDDAAHLQ